MSSDIILEEMTNDDGVTFFRSTNRDGRLHSDNDYMAYEIIDASGDIVLQAWFDDGIIHRDGGPAVVASQADAGDIFLWFYNGVPHRPDGPAVHVEVYNEDQFIGAKEDKFFYMGAKLSNLEALEEYANRERLSNHHVVCSQCEGCGTMRCELCSGVGAIQELTFMTRCKHCKGTGLVSCDKCGGKWHYKCRHEGPLYAIVNVDVNGQYKRDGGHINDYAYASSITQTLSKTLYFCPGCQRYGFISHKRYSSSITRPGPTSEAGESYYYFSVGKWYKNPPKSVDMGYRVIPRYHLNPGKIASGFDSWWAGYGGDPRDDYDKITQVKLFGD